VAALQRDPRRALLYVRIKTSFSVVTAMRSFLFVDFPAPPASRYSESAERLYDVRLGRLDLGWSRSQIPGNRRLIAVMNMAGRQCSRVLDRFC